MNQNFYNGFQNMNNSTVNNQVPVNLNNGGPYSSEYKPPKKRNIGIIVVVVIAVIAIGIGCFFIFGGKSKSESNNNDNNNENKDFKSIVYLNEENNSKDSLFFELQSSSNNGKGVFFGITGKGVANNLKFDSYSLFNSMMEINDYDPEDKVSFYYNEEYFNFELESAHYMKDSTGEYFDENSIVYKDKNFFVIETNIDNYLIYYLYDDDKYYFADDDDEVTHREWKALDIFFCDSIDEAKENISNIRDNIDICVYDKNDSFNNCITEDGQKINYKEYRYIKDLIIDSLKNYNLYLNSYEDIVLMGHDGLQIETYVEFEDIDEDDLIEFELSLRDYQYDEEDYKQSIMLNGSKLPVSVGDYLCMVALTQQNGYINVYVNLPYDVERNIENIQKAFQESFSKTK